MMTHASARKRQISDSLISVFDIKRELCDVYAAEDWQFDSADR